MSRATLSACLLLALAALGLVLARPELARLPRAWLGSDPEATLPGQPADDADAEARAELPEASPKGDVAEQAPQQRAAYGRVRVQAETQTLAGLAASAVEPASRLVEARGVARVLDLTPLHALRAERHGFEAEAAAAAAAITAGRAEVERLRRLQREGAGVPQRELQQAEGRLQADTARAAGLARQLEDLAIRARQEWGEVLAGAALSEDSALQRQLAASEDFVLLVTLPGGTTLGEGVTLVHVDRQGDRARAREAHRLSPAPRGDSSLQGETWFFLTPAEGLRTGMRLDVWAPLGGEPAQGVSVPLSAVVWHEGRPWVYVQTGPEEFERRLVPEDAREFADTLLVTQGLAAGERVVSRGAQTVLSEELRWAIPDEDDDD